MDDLLLIVVLFSLFGIAASIGYKSGFKEGYKECQLDYYEREWTPKPRRHSDDMKGDG